MTGAHGPAAPESQPEPPDTAEPSSAARSTVLPTESPLLVWLGIGVGLFALEAGALANFLVSVLGDALAAGSLPGAEFVAGIQSVTAQLPTLLSRETVPNGGYWNGSRWVGTFLGLRPGVAWAIRAGLIYAYAFAVAGWAILGYRLYRREYRVADWTPRDDVVDRFRSHGWGLFGLVVVWLFVVMAVFAPALGPTTVDQNMRNSYSNELTYWDTESQSVETILVGQHARPIGVVPEREREDRYRGYDTDQIDALGAVGDPLLVKADGARMRRFKAPSDREPRIPETADTVVPIASTHVVGKPLSDERVHRVDRVAEITGLSPGEEIGAEDVGAVLASEDGGRKGVPSGATAIPLVNMVDDEELERRARDIAAAVHERADVPHVVLAELRADDPLVTVAGPEDG